MRRRQERTGLLWLIAGFVVCPCHLPITLALLAAPFAAMGFDPFRHGAMVVGAVLTAAWALATWRGLSLLRSADRRSVACERCRRSPH